jgi:UDP-N-acetylmuramate dehydrogenase
MIEGAARRALERCLAERVEFDVALARHTSLRIGGPADAIATPKDRTELAQTLRICTDHALPTTVLGAGFNVLVREGGIRGVVLRLKKLRHIDREAVDLISIEAGASHATITRYCIEHALGGLEFAAGIPGTLGGWLAMNAGIGVREMKDVVSNIDIMDRQGERVLRIARDELVFRYRALEGLAPGSIIVAAQLQIEESERANVQSEVDRLLADRQSSQPIDIPSCGSVFRNPPARFAGQLIETVGLKGAREGAAEISSVHANFIVNRGGATADDVLRLIERARAKVADETGIRLETEVHVLGVDLGETEDNPQ